jgi:hypothetical protein
MFAFVEKQNKLLQEKLNEEQAGKKQEKSNDKEVVIAARVGEVEPCE